MSSGRIETRRKILTACWTLLDTDAGAGVRMSDIAKAAGVSRQALYLHFKTRADLFIATTQFIDEALASEDHLASYRAAHDPAEKIAIFISEWARHMENIQGVARALFVAAPTDPEADAAWSERMAAIHALCLDMTKGLAAAGRLRPGLSAKRAADLLAVTISFQTWDRLRHDYGWSRGAYVSHITAQALTGLTGELAS